MKRTLLALAFLVLGQATASADLLPGFERIGKDNKKQGLPTDQYGNEICILAGSVSEFWACRTESVLSFVSDLVNSQKNASKEYSNSIKNCNKNPIIAERSKCINAAAKVLQANSKNVQAETRDWVKEHVDDIVTWHNPKKKKSAQAAAKAKLLPPPATDGGNAPMPGNWPGTNPDPNAGPNK